MTTIDTLIQEANKKLKTSSKVLCVWPSHLGEHKVGVHYATKYKFNVLNIMMSETMIDKGRALALEELNEDDVHIIKNTKDIRKGCSFITIKLLSSHKEIQDRLIECSYDLCVFYDAHKLLGRSYLSTIQTLLNNKNIRKSLAISATPFRDDGMGLGSFFGEIGFYYDITMAMQEKNMRMAQYSSVDNEYSEQLDRYKTILNILSQEAKATIIYCKSSEDVTSLCQYLRTQNISVREISSSYTKAQEDVVLEDFKYNRIDVLCNYGVMNERIESRYTDRIILSRNITSLAYYAQVLTSAAKDIKRGDLEIIDLFNNEVITNLNTMRENFSFKKVDQKLVAKEKVNKKHKELPALNDEITNTYSYSINELDIKMRSELVSIGEYFVIPLGYVKRFLLISNNFTSVWQINKNEITNITKPLPTIQSLELWIKEQIKKYKDDKSYNKLYESMKDKPSEKQLFYVSQFIELKIITTQKKWNRYEAAAVMSYGFYTAFKDNIKLNFSENSSSNKRYTIEENGSVVGAKNISDVIDAFIDNRVYIKAKKLYVLFKNIEKYKIKKEPIPTKKVENIYYIGDYKYTDDDKNNFPIINLIEGYCLKYNILGDENE